VRTKRLINRAGIRRFLLEKQQEWGSKKQRISKQALDDLEQKFSLFLITQAAQTLPARSTHEARKATQ
jgi:hypothetical protein